MSATATAPRIATAIALPPEVAYLVETIGKRYGMWFGKKLVLKEANTATKDLSKDIRQVAKDLKPLNEALNSKIGAYIENGADVREEVKGIVAQRKELNDKRKTLVDQKTTARLPFADTMSGLSDGISYLDYNVVPIAFQKATGNPIMPITVCPPDLVAEMAEAAKRAEEAKKRTAVPTVVA